jgi:hypothetical protein
MGLFQFANSMGYISKLGQDLIKKSGIELIQDLWMICGGVVAFAFRHHGVDGKGAEVLKAVH